MAMQDLDHIRRGSRYQPAVQSYAECLTVLSIALEPDQLRRLGTLLQFELAAGSGCLAFDIGASLVAIADGDWSVASDILEAANDDITRMHAEDDAADDTDVAAGLARLVAWLRQQ